MSEVFSSSADVVVILPMRNCTVRLYGGKCNFSKKNKNKRGGGLQTTKPENNETCDSSRFIFSGKAAEMEVEVNMAWTSVLVTDPLLISSVNLTAARRCWARRLASDTPGRKCKLTPVEFVAANFVSLDHTLSETQGQKSIKHGFL